MSASVTLAEWEEREWGGSQASHPLFPYPTKILKSDPVTKFAAESVRVGHSTLGELSTVSTCW